MSTSCVLLQFGADPFNNKFEEMSGVNAFTVTTAGYNPNAVIKLTRESSLAESYPSILGPDNSYFYLGPENGLGYIVYGNNRNTIPMSYFLRQKRVGSPSRYFTGQSGRDYKWRIAQDHMELFDGRSSIAEWRLSDPDDDFDARLVIKPAGMPFITEIMTTLVLNRMAQELSWSIPSWP